MAMGRWVRRIGLAVLVGCLTLAWDGVTVSSAREVPPRDTPVVFVHGFTIFSLCPLSDVEITFGTARRTLSDWGRSGPMPAVGYYACDQNIADGDWIDAHGPAGHAGPYGERGHLSHLTEPRLSHSADTDIRHLAYHLAWFIWDRWSSEGQAVHLVGNSMGGLVARWMMYRVDAGDPAYPPTVLVDRAVMVGTPFAGFRDLIFDACTTLSFDALQCGQMQAGSPFLHELAGWQGTGGARWHTLATTCDELVPPSSARAIAPAQHYLYTLPCYMHNGPLSMLNSASARGPVLLSEQVPGTGRWQPAHGRPALALMHDLLP